MNYEIVRLFSSSFSRYCFRVYFSFCFPSISVAWQERESGLQEIGLKGAKRCCELPQFCEESKRVEFSFFQFCEESISRKCEQSKIKVGWFIYLKASKGVFISISKENSGDQKTRICWSKFTRLQTVCFGIKAIYGENVRYRAYIRAHLVKNKESSIYLCTWHS